MDKQLLKDVLHEWRGRKLMWGVNVAFGDRSNYPATVRRYYYATRAQARAGDISDCIGQRGRLA